jgi:uncharacterized protein (TIGR00251 family)
MTKPATHLLESVGGATLAIRVTPRARRNEITQIMTDGTIKIRLTAPPVEGKANTALIKFLAEILQVTSSSIKILSGESGRSKLILVSGMKADVANQRILEALSKQA